MLFRRRKRLNVLDRLRGYVWPRQGWVRSSRYVVYRLWRLRATPHAIAVGAACGAFVSFLPLMGLHFLSAGLLAWILRSSIIASALGTAVGNPLTFPLIWIGSYTLGKWILGEPALREEIYLADSLFQSSLDKLWPLLVPMTIGGIPMGLAGAAVTYIVVKKAVVAYQARRKRQRLGLDAAQA